MNSVFDATSIPRVIGSAVTYFWWLIFPITFYYIFKILYKDYVAFYSVSSWNNLQKWTFLEVIPPRDIEKGPKTMESIFSGMMGVLTTYNTFDEYLKGAFWHDRFGLELVGEEGKVHFYFRVQKKYRSLIEAHVYAQYPDAQIIEVSDYTNDFPKVVPNKNWDLWGVDFKFTDADPVPIKTYDKFEESVTGEMVDPMSALVEVMGALGPGQHLWLQYILQPLQEPENYKYGSVIKKLKGEPGEEKRGIFGDITDVFGNIFKGMLGPVEFKATEKRELQPLEFRLTPVEKEKLKLTEENIGKAHFRTKMRMICIGRRENFDKSNVSSFVGAVKQFNDMNFNQVIPEDVSKTYAKIFFKEGRLAFRKRKIYSRYKKRNVDGVKIVLSAKELATLFHFPDMGVKSPAVQRTEAKLGAAPLNLPIE